MMGVVLVGGLGSKRFNLVGHRPGHATGVGHLALYRGLLVICSVWLPKLHEESALKTPVAAGS